ncbi:MAG TPA: type II secretion system F family protein [Clostridia bacterium]|nr:type II secretion system F family protein [Clostridia bacterium]
MAYFIYRSVDPKGKIVKGNVEAIDKAAALYIIKQKGLIPLEVNVDKDFTHWLRKVNYNRIPVKDIAILCRQFAAILTAGVTVLSAMDMLRKQTSNKRLRNAVDAAFEDLQKGRTLSQSLRAREGIFPELLVSMIEAGELSGTLDNTMVRMAAHYEKESWITGKVKAAMTYPLILLSVSLLMVIFLVYFILPNFMTLIDTSGGEIPALTRTVMNATEFVRTRWYVVIAVFVAAAVAFRYFTTRKKGRRLYHGILLRVPVLGKVIKRIVASKFTRTLGILLASGISLLSSLESVRNVVGNAVAEEAIENALTAVKNGEGLAASLEATPIFDTMVVKMIQIGEDTGSLDEMLIKTADFFDTEVEAGLTQLMLLIEPIMLILMGTIVGVIVVAMLLPMYGMLNNLNI